MAFMQFENNARGNHGKKQHWEIVLLLLLSLIAFLGSPALASPQQNPNGHDQIVPGHILVKFHPNVPAGRVLQLVSEAQAQLEDRIPQLDVLMLRIPPGLTEEQLMERFSKQSEVLFSELDYWRPPAQSYPVSMTPSDPYYSSQWHLAKISLPSAWNTTTGAADLKIAILDTGVDKLHPDLAGKLLPGWNFYDNNDDVSDPHGHGTAVAGTAAAISNNGVGVAAPAWNCQILPIRISDPNGWAYDSTIANALVWAADQGAKVANISFAVTTSSTVTSAAQYFQSKGGVVAVAAGNDALVISNADNPYVLTVGATDSTDTLASWSNTGNNIDLVAPGVNIKTTVKGGGYGLWSGTSFSSPLVAGVAALVMSANPNLSPAQVQNAVKQSATDLGTVGWDATYGFGRLDAARAIGQTVTTDTVSPTINIAAPLSGTTISGTFGVKVNAADNIAVNAVTYLVDGIAVGTVTNAPFDFAWNTLTTAANGTRTLTAVAADSAGNTASASVTVTVKNTDATKPTVKILSPAAKTTVSGIVTVQVSATDNNMVASVSLTIDGKLYQTINKAPYNFVWDTAVLASSGANLYANGSHTLLARADDGYGNYSTTSIAVTVSNADKVAPTVSITSPSDGAKTTLSKISVTHSTWDNQKVTKVELYVDGVLKTSSTAAPFTISWTTLAGTHKLQSKAYDAAGNYGFSQIVNVTK